MGGIEENSPAVSPLTRAVCAAFGHHKYLLRGDVLIDDRRKRGAGAFHGLHLHFGEHGDVPDWDAVLVELEKVT